MKNYTYLWEGKTSQGQITSGTLINSTFNLAKLELTKKNIHLTTIRKKSFLDDLFIKKSNRATINKRDIILFLRQLSTLIIAGIPIAQALHIFNRSEQTKLLSITSSLITDISAGQGLSYSLQKFPRYFDEMTCNLIQAGEKAGTLDRMLERIADHKEKVSLLLSKIKQALFYPAIIMSVAIVVTITLLTFVVPRFAELFETMHSQLPVFTQAIISLASILQSDGWILLILFSSSLALIYHFRHTVYIKKKLDNMQLNSPWIGMLIKKFIIARFSRGLATLFAAGIPLSEALKILAKTTGSLAFGQAIQQLCLDISAGKQLHFAMQPCKLFPPMMLQLIQVGEESGSLEKMLVKLAEFYEADIDYVIANLGRILEPLIMIILGVLIGGLVIAMYLPIFKLGTVI